MPAELTILIAFCLDALVGDPRWLTHPVRIIGSVAMSVETLLRKVLHYDLFAGLITVFIMVSITGLVTWLLLAIGHQIYPLIGDLLAIMLLYTTVAAHDLTAHSHAVHKRLIKKDIAGARQTVAMIVGRDTENLNESEVTRAAIESVAESTVDGVTAPLFYALIAGPVGAMVYKAVNTLDSMFGYKNDRYMKFGWASAKLDDVANYLPARLTAPVMCLAAGLLCLRPVNAFKVMLRDGKKHTSPNAGLAEAAMAGALGVQLGGENVYFGRPVAKPLIGKQIQKLSHIHIKQANQLMYVTSALFLFLGLLLRMAVINLGY
jgi:adenosylcobinamide-phosphate synthase